MDPFVLKNSSTQSPGDLMDPREAWDEVNPGHFPPRQGLLFLLGPPRAQDQSGLSCVPLAPCAQESPPRYILNVLCV